MHGVTDLVDGVYLYNLHPGSILDVETRSRHYRVEYMGGDEIRISGHPDYCPYPVRAELLGSLGSNGVVHGFLGRGMRLEYCRLSDGLPVITSVINNIREN